MTNEHIYEGLQPVNEESYSKLNPPQHTNIYTPLKMPAAEHKNGIFSFDSDTAKISWRTRLIVGAFLLLCVILLMGIVAIAVMYNNASKQNSHQLEEVQLLSAEYAKLTAQHREVSENFSFVSELNEASKLNDIPFNCSEISRPANEKDLEIFQLRNEKQALSKALSELKDTFCMQRGAITRCHVCPSGWTAFYPSEKNSLSTSCYYFSTANKHTWEQGREDCKNNSADYVVINNDLEKEFLSLFANKNEKYWIGLSDIATEGDWVWVNGKKLTKGKVKWDVGQPDNNHRQDSDGEDCAAIIISAISGLITHDFSCQFTCAYICEKMGTVITV
ncbi:low affinity immunoglobulin epsilon Fc receptor-like [Protopterus annectens]|uniref:low affinity immunoglobulin epsilon Fc receptor-like n=1 Tax=Protopterus annectens TaxID=7888 RepID=UPI001CFB3F13|nr:low affinity immunoglobulin epsilon Fc receptor-like [Protopterus annectens]